VKETVVTSNKATTIKEGSANSNFGGNALLQLGGSTQRSVLIYWDLASIPQGAEVLQAEMVVFLDDDTGDATNDSYAIHELLRSWEESNSTGASWNHAVRSSVSWTPPGATGVGDSSPVRLGMMPLGSDQAFSISLEAPLNAAGRSVVEKWINNPATNFGFLIDAESGSNNTMEFLSDDNTSNTPQLRVIYLDPACQP
jgi:hypothetical protein